jgi:hypothetical protein
MRHGSNWFLLGGLSVSSGCFVSFEDHAGSAGGSAVSGPGSTSDAAASSGTTTATTGTGATPTSSSSDGGQGGQGQPCVGPEDCDPPGECRTATCEDELCGEAHANAGEECDGGGGRCSDDGQCVECLTEAHCSDVPPACQTAGTACRTACSVDSHCSAGNICEGTTCFPS